MENSSFFLAKFWGWYLIIFFAILSFNPKRIIQILKDFEDENGKVQPRLVDINSDMAQLFINNLIYISEKDYKKAKKYVSDPATYDFKKILNWN